MNIPVPSPTARENARLNRESQQGWLNRNAFVVAQVKGANQAGSTLVTKGWEIRPMVSHEIWVAAMEISNPIHGAGVGFWSKLVITGVEDRGCGEFELSVYPPMIAEGGKFRNVEKLAANGAEVWMESRQAVAGEVDAERERAAKVAEAYRCTRKLGCECSTPHGEEIAARIRCGE